MNLAPIGVSTYARKAHLAQTLEALANNRLAEESELFVFSDAPRRGDESAVAEVRSLVRRLKGFKKVHLIERATNDRVFNNRDGHRQLLEAYGRCIFLEEDVVTAPTFLEFINDGLKFFENDEKIFAVCGYTPPIDVSRIYSGNSLLCRRFSAWGFGIWLNRYRSIERGRLDPNSLGPVQMWRLRSAGTDLMNMVERMSREELEALDVRINFTMARSNLRIVCPARSLTNNEGHDGTGIHCGDTDHFSTALDTRASVDWQLDKARCSRKVDKKFFFFRGKHVNRRKNQILYHLSRNIDYQN